MRRALLWLALALPALAQYTIPPGTGSGAGAGAATQLLSGCGVEYTSGLIFTVGACNYTVGGATFGSPITTVTLTAADMTNPRIDVIGVDNTGAVFSIPGTAASSPSEPSIDPSTQIGLIFVTVAANATTPSGIGTTLLYDENTEWTCTPTAHINCASTSNPYHGTTDIEATAAVLGNNFTLIKPAAGTTNLATQTSLVFYIRSKAAWPSANGNGPSGRRTLSLVWLNGAAQVGTTVVLADGVFGFNSSNTTAYQQISIPIGLFGTGSSLVTTLTATASGNGGASSFGWYIDEVSLQAGIPTPATGCVVVSGVNGSGPDCILTTTSNPLTITSDDPLDAAGAPIEQLRIVNPSTTNTVAQTNVAFGSNDGSGINFWGWVGNTSHQYIYNPALADFTYLENNNANGGGVAVLVDKPGGFFDVYTGGYINTTFRRMRVSGAGAFSFPNGTVTSAVMRGWITDSSGTGLALFQNGALGTPVSGTLTNVLGLPIGGLVAIGADNVIINPTAGSAIPTTQAVPTCASDGTHALTYAAHTLGCATISGAGAGVGTSVTNITPVTVSANTTSDQQLMELTLAAGYFNSGGQPFLFNGAGIYTTPVAQTPTLTFKVKLCTVSGCGSGTVVTLVNIPSTATLASSTNNTWNVNFMGYTANTGATGNLEIHGPLNVDLGSLSTAPDSLFNDTNTAVSSNIDLTAALFIDFTVATSSGSASNSITQRSGGVMPFAATAAPVTSVNGQTGAVTCAAAAGKCLISTQSGAAGSYTWSAIPATYNNLSITCTARGDTSALIIDLDMQFNADAAGNYNYNYLKGTAGAASNNGTTGASFIFAGDISAATALASAPGIVNIQIPGYATAFLKTVVGLNSDLNANGITGARELFVPSGMWNNTAAITSIKLFPSAGAFTAASTCQLYGEK